MCTNGRLFIGLFLMFFAVRGFAQFTPGNLVVLRVGDGSTSLSSSACAISLVEYSTSGTATGTVVNMPTAVSGSNRILTQSGTATSEGDLSLSVNKQYLVLCGYDAATGSSSVATTSNYNGVVGRVDANGTVNTATYFLRTSGNAFVNDNFRSACSVDGTAYWASGNSTGSTGGVRYITHGTAGSAGTKISATVTNTRTVNIFDNQLYVSSGSSSFRLCTVGSGLPTGTGNTISNLNGLPSSSYDPYAFVFFDRDTSVAGVDLCYVSALGSTGTGGLYKYSYNGTTWTARGSVAGNCRGLTGTVNCAGTIDLYVTVSTSSGVRPTLLYKVNDNAAYNATISAGSLGSSIATAGSNYAFGGVAFSPENNLTITSTQTIAAGTYSKIKIKSGGVATLSGNVTITDSVIVYSGGTLGCAGYTISGLSAFTSSFTLQSGGSIKIGSANGITASAASGNIQTCTRSYSTGANYEYYAATSQVTGNGLPATVHNFTINNSNGLPLGSAVAVTNTAYFSSGVLTTTATNILTLKSAATVSPSGGKSTSYVSGPMDWEVFDTTELVFPSGKDTMWAKATVKPKQSDSRGTPSRIYRCEYFNTGYGTYTINTAQVNPLDHISYVEYWLISEQSGASGSDDDVKIKLYWRTMSNVGTTAAIRQGLRVAHFISGQWNHEGTSPTIADNGVSDGSVQSDWVSTFSPFTLGSVTGYNPLPVELVSAHGDCDHSDNRISWTATSERQVMYYKVQRYDDNMYHDIGIVDVSTDAAPVKDYWFSDINAGGDHTYRLSEVDLSGNETVLAIVQIHCNYSTKPVVNIAQSAEMIRVSTTRHPAIKLNYLFTNTIGQILQEGSFDNILELNKSALVPGIYLLYIRELDKVFKLPVY